MKVLKVLLLIVIFVLLVVGFTGVQGGINAQRVLTPGFYVSVLKGQGVFESVGDLVIATIEEEFGRFGMPPAEKEKFVAAFRQVLGAEWLESQVRDILADVLRVVNGRQTEITATVALSELLQRLYEAYAPTGDPEVTRGMREVLSGAPVELALADMIDPAMFAPAVHYFRQARLAFTVVLVVSLLLALACFPLAGGFPGGARWVATALLVSGGLGVAASFVASAQARLALAGLDVGSFGQEVATLITSAATGLVAAVVWVVRSTGLAYIALAVILFVAAALVASARRRRAAAVAAGSTPATTAAGATSAGSAPAGTTPTGTS